MTEHGPSPADSSPQNPPTAVLRFPAIRLNTLYRLAEIAHARGQLGGTKLRLLRFLNTQRLDGRTGRIEGRYGTDQVDGGLSLAERYACVYGVGTDRFWDDLKGLYRAGLAEQVQKPAPGRRAVYALCLRVDAIPRDLPDDLLRELRHWELPEAEDVDEDAVCGRLADCPAPAVEQVAAPGGAAKLRDLARRLAVKPRWEHPAGSPAALAAQAIEESAKRMPTLEIPSLTHATAVAKPTRAADMTARVEELLEQLKLDGKPSPYYAKGHNPGGSTAKGSRGLDWSKKHGTDQRTPLRAAEALAEALAADPGDTSRSRQAAATAVLRHAWATWRRELGCHRVLVPTGHWDDEGIWHDSPHPTWADLHRLVETALQRTTPAEIHETLSGSMASAESVSRVAAGRLWRLINLRRDRHEYAGHVRRGPAQAPHVTAWDAAGLERRRWLAEEATAAAARQPAPAAESVTAELRQRMRDEEERRRQEAETVRAAQLARWGISTAPLREHEEAHRAELMRHDPKALREAQLARWGISTAPLREPEEVHQAATGQLDQAADAPPDPEPRRDPDEVRKAALDRARAEKKAARRARR